MDHLVITVFAPDKPGLIELIAKCIADQGGNWLESRMSHMAGQFTGIIRIGAPVESHEALKSALLELSGRSIRVLFAETATQSPGTWKHIGMELVGNDRPGIVRDITRLLSGQGVNVERLTTEVKPAPMSSELLFHADAILGVPESLALDDLQEALETLADDLMVELVLRTDL